MENQSKICKIFYNSLMSKQEYSFAQVLVGDLGFGFYDVMYTCLKLNLTKKCPAKVKRKEVSGEKSSCQSSVNRPVERYKGVRYRNNSRQKTQQIWNSSQRSSETMTHVPLLTEADNTQNENNKNTVMLEVGLPGDTWRYCVERHRLAEKSEWFRALLLGPLAPTEKEQTIKLQHIDKRAFDHLLRYLHDETVIFQSVSTARSTLDVAHQYLCPGLAQLVVDFLDWSVKEYPSTALEVYQGLSLYASDLSMGRPVPSAPSKPEDDAGEIACACAKLLATCLRIIDSHPETILRQERFEELNGQEVANLASRDSLQLTKESYLFVALERWASSECRRHGVEPNPINKRKVLTDDVLFSVRFLLMSDEEFVSGPMLSNMLTNEESAYIMAKILGYNNSQEKDMNLRVTPVFISQLNSTPRGRTKHHSSTSISSSNTKECEDNKKNRRKECVNQGQKVCAQIGNCFVRVLACVFD